MSRKAKYKAIEKQKIIEYYERSVLSLSEVAERYEISKSALENWIRKYRENGQIGLENRKKNTSYSREIKQQAVEEYLTGCGSLFEISIKFGLSSTYPLRQWIRKYNNGHSELKTYHSGGSRTMSKGRKTEWKERIEIAQYCIVQNYAYQKTAEKYEVSYQQVYQWVGKLEKSGENALKDSRGRKKSDEEISDLDREKLAFKKLEAENERLRAENLLLKKLEEIERWRN